MSARLSGLDAARFVAFVGMVLVNFRIAAQVTPDTSIPSHIIDMFEGRAAALFVVLAGIGYSLGAFDTATTVKRAGVLFVLGLLNQTIFEADIIHFYALYFIVALPFVRRSGRATLIAAAIILGISFLALIGLDYEQGWNWDTLQYADFWTLSGFMRNSFYNGWHPVLPWIVFFLVGMWAGKLALGQPGTQARLIIGGALISTATGALSRWLSAVDPQLAEIAGISPIPPGPLYIIAATSSALAVIGLFLRLAEPLDRWRIAGWLNSPGRMSLTLYFAHILLGMGILQALGLLDGSLGNATILAYALGFCVLSALFARVWTDRFKRGPLEAFLRHLTQG